MSRSDPAAATERELARSEWVEERVRSLQAFLTGQEPDLTLVLRGHRIEVFRRVA